MTEVRVSVLHMYMNYNRLIDAVVLGTERKLLVQLPGHEKSSQSLGDR